MTEREIDGVTADELLDDRHPSVAHVARFLLVPNPGLGGVQREVAGEYAAMTRRLLDLCPDGPELTDALRRLLTSKDAAVRTAL